MIKGLIQTIIVIMYIVFPLEKLYANNKEIDSLQNALKLATADTQKVNIYNQLSYIKCDVDFQTAIDYGLKAKKLSHEIGFTEGEAYAIFLIGVAHQEKGEYQKAISYYFQALKLYEAINHKKGIAKTYSYIGFIYRYQNNFEKAIEYQKIAFDNYKTINDKEGIASTLVNIGNVFFSSGELNKAIENYQEALKYFADLKDDESSASIYNNIGAVYFNQEKFKLAIDYFVMAYKIREKLGNKYNLATSLNNIGEVYGKLEKYDLAIDYCYKSLAISKNIDARDLMLYNYENLALLYSAKGDNLNAFKFMKLNSLLKDSVLSIENNKQINELSVKYETEKKEGEIKILTQKNEIQNLEVSRQKLFKNGFIIGFILILIIAFVLYNRYQLKQKANAKLEAQKKEITRQHQELNVAYELIGAKNKDITDSIKYAKRIQEAILPTRLFEQEVSNSGFIFYRPKDIVSGDFYWMHKEQNKLLISAVDCTGHGVPGAFMSIVGYNILNKIVKEHGVTQPNLILDELNKGVTESLRQTEKDSTVKDGMDISLCSINYDTLELSYAGAYNPLWIVRGNTLIELEANKFPIGTFIGERINTFDNNKFKLEKNDMIYLFTDGYADQFGGPNGKKFKYKQFKNSLVENSSKSPSEQRLALELALDNWMGSLQQVDDVLVIGIKI